MLSVNTMWNEYRRQFPVRGTKKGQGQENEVSIRGDLKAFYGMKQSTAAKGPAEHPDDMESTRIPPTQKQVIYKGFGLLVHPTWFVAISELWAQWADWVGLLCYKLSDDMSLWLVSSGICATTLHASNLLYTSLSEGEEQIKSELRPRIGFKLPHSK